MKNRILVIAAHPDDEILGCGGTMAKFAIGEGAEVFTLILGEGIAARYKEKNVDKLKDEVKELKKQALEANRLLGVRDVFIYNFPDNRFDTVSFLDIVKVVEGIKGKIKPNIIFTHYERDLNIDHQTVCRAVITATRPLCNESVKQIYSFEVASSTEWHYPLSFSPDVFFDIEKYLGYKLKAMKIYKSELKAFPHPRSLEGIKLNARYWGMHVGLKSAESFKAIRVIR